MKNNKIKEFFYSSNNWVTIYAILYMILTVVYCLPRLLCQTNIISMDSISAGFTLPLNIFAWGLTAICSGYCGMDRAVSAIKSSTLEVGTCDMGDPSKVRKIIRLLFAIFIESLLLNFFFGTPYDTYVNVWDETIGELGDWKEVLRTYPGVDIPLEGVATALVSAITFYILGNKAVRLTSSVTSSKNVRQSEVDRTIVSDNEGTHVESSDDDVTLM